MIQKGDFFTAENKVLHIPDEEYAQIPLYIESLDAFARTTFRSIYVIDYFKRNFLYVSDNPLFLCGMSAEEVRELGYEFYLRHVPEDDYRLLLEANRVGFLFVERVPPKHRQEYTFSCDFHICPPQAKPLLINHKITPLRLAPDGCIWLTFCIASLSSRATSGHIEVSRKGYNMRWKYDLDNGRWEEQPAIRLSESERQTLLLSAQGYTIEQIADRVSRTPDSVKSYRRKLFEKLEVDNITEAISFAMNEKLI
ncbi:response regulator transcription factor [Tannerella forsythia]|nr:helix-turn-helix transcriptional regulator [Tannerella forsythia]